MRWIAVNALVLAIALSIPVLAEEARSSADEARRAKVFAKIGSETITVGTLEDMINARSRYARARLIEPDATKELAEGQVRNELFYQGAEKLGYADDPDVVKFVDQTLVQLFIRRDFQDAVTPDDVPAQDVAKYYEEQTEEFRRPEMRRARHILVGSKKEAETILSELKSGEGATFRAAAKQRSLDTETNIRGGDLLYFTADGKLVGKRDAPPIDPTLVKAAFELKDKGDLGGPLDLGDGKWSVIELTGIRPEMVQTLQQANGAIRRKLWREEREAALDKLIADLRAELKPEVHPERIDAIVLEPTDQPIEPPNQ
jgi:parvulin-like peptidyl-prolyl isomerase